MGFRVLVKGSELGKLGSIRLSWVWAFWGFGVQGFGFSGLGFGFRVSGFGFRVWGLTLGQTRRGMWFEVC